MFGNLINNALSSTKRLSSVVKDVIQKDVQIYDASKNVITIGGMEARGWESASISDSELTKEYIGMERNEVAIVKQIFVRKLTMSFLPTEPTFKKLEVLSQLCMEWNKFFIINITENGEWIGDYQAQFSNVGGRKMQQEADNMTMEFYLVPFAESVRQNLRVVDKTDSIGDLIETFPTT